PCRSRSAGSPRCSARRSSSRTSAGSPRPRSRIGRACRWARSRGGCGWASRAFGPPCCRRMRWMERAVAEQRFAGMTCAEAAELAAAFVLGALGAAESDAVRRHLAECPELHAEMGELHSVVPALFEAVEPVAPPAGLRDRILAAAAADLAARQAPARPAPAPISRPIAQPVPSRRGWDLGAIFPRPVWAAVRAAAVAAAVALGAWNGQLRDQVADLESYRNGVVQVLDEAARPGAPP